MGDPPLMTIVILATGLPASSDGFSASVQMNIITKKMLTFSLEIYSYKRRNMKIKYFGSIPEFGMGWAFVCKTAYGP